MHSVGDEATLRELAERLLGRSHPLGGSTTVELLPGQLASEHGVELPLPPGGKLLGSAVHRRNGRLASVHIVVDVDRPVRPLISAYEEQLRGFGWSPGGPFGGGGFVPTGSMPWRTYHRGRDGPLLMVSTDERGSGLNELRLQLDYEGYQFMRHPLPPDGGELIPSLLPPPGVQLEGGGGGGSETHWSSQATARTDMPTTEVEAYFAGQLTAADWTRRSGASDEVVAWSIWDVPGKDEWKGLLIVIGTAAGHDRMLTVHVQRASRPRGGWGQAMSSMLGG